MKHYRTLGCLLVLFLAGFGAAAPEARPQQAPLGQEEYQDAEDWFEIGLSLNAEGKFQESADAFARSVAVDPENPVAWLNLGTAHALTGKFEDSIGELKKSIELEPNLPLAYANLGEIYFKVQRYQDAVGTFGKLLTYWPDDANAHFKLGLAHLALNDSGKAQAEYLTLKILDPDMAAQLNQAIDQKSPR